MITTPHLRFVRRTDSYGKERLILQQWSYCEGFSDSGGWYDVPISEETDEPPEFWSPE